MSSGEILAAAAHLHVLLRRKTGRVTDTEWMAGNREYARAMIAFARDSANQDGHTDLLPLAERLETLMALAVPTATSARETKAPRSGNDSSFEPAEPATSGQPAPDALSSRYIGRLR
ncbi:MAG: hypothetical protein LT081_06830 [Hydrogenophaga sp.]|nr:hypothetical protein [Hydrogenophaga sp.]